MSIQSLIIVCILGTLAYTIHVPNTMQMFKQPNKILPTELMLRNE